MKNGIYPYYEIPEIEISRQLVEYGKQSNDDKPFLYTKTGGSITSAEFSDLVKECATYLLSEGLAAASEADLTILCLGLNRHFEGEDTGHDDDFSDYGDRKTLNLPKTQMKLAEAVCDVAKNLVVVVMCGSATDVGEKVRNHAKAIIHGWYPGAVGGLAIAELIAGEYSPMGRLPLSFYHAVQETASLGRLAVSVFFGCKVKDNSSFPSFLLR